MSEENQRLQELFQKARFRPTSRLHQIIEAGLSEANRISRDDGLVTVPFLILGILFVGRHRPQNLEFATNFYNAIGSDETDNISKRVRQLHSISSHSTPAKEMPWISSEYLDVLETSTSSSLGNIDEISPEDTIVTLLDKRPQECQILFPQHVDIWATLTAATLKAVEGLPLTDSLKSRLRHLELDREDVSSSSETSNLRSSRPPSVSIQEWRQYFKTRYGKQFTDVAVRIVIDAVGAAANERGIIDNLITVNSKHLLSPLVIDSGPLSTLYLGNYAGAHTGVPPWHEPQNHTDESEEARKIYGNTRPSVQFASILQTAASLTETTIGFPEVTEWHLAFAAISSSANGIKWQLHGQKSSLTAATIVLRRNLANRQPELEPLFNWSDLEDDSEPHADEDVEESQLDDASRRWSRDFQKLRKPKDFKWSVSCGRALDALWHSHGIAVAFARQSKQRAKRFNPELTTRSFFLACLRSGADREKDVGTASGGDGELLSVLFKSTGKTVEQLDKLLQDELHRGQEESGEEPVPSLVSDGLAAAISRANEIRLNTGNDSHVSTRHLIAALFHPSESGGTGSRVLLSSDGIGRKPILDTLATDIARTPRGIERDQPGLWLPWLERLRQGMEHPLPGSDDQPQKHTPTGGKHHASRNPHPDELCLDIDVYASAAAQLLRNASDESDFVFGLFGPWGRGKTTLAEKIQAQVENHGYVSVKFCAWKFPTRPEVWVHLYQEIAGRAQQCLDTSKERADLETSENTSWLQSARVSFRVGLLNQGWTPIVLGALLLLVSRLQWFEVAQGVTSAIGWSGVFLLAMFTLRSTQWIRSLRLHYGVLPNHRDKLGLQAVIGEDLTRLIKVWIQPDSGKQPKELKKWWLLWLASGMASLACCIAAVKIVDKGFERFSASSGLDSPLKSNKEADHFHDLVSKELPRPLAWAFSSVNPKSFDPVGTSLILGSILATLGVSCIIFGIVLRIEPRSFKKLLLVIDDLDRCEPDQMLAVVESLRVFLDRTEMSRRIQILMLIDDRKLDQAILKRAREQRWHPKSKQERTTYCREQREKYFVTAMRLFPLDPFDISAVTSKILDREANESQAKRVRELEQRREQNQRILKRDEDDVSETIVVKPRRVIPDPVGPGRSREVPKEVVPESTRAATPAEIEEQKQIVLAEKEMARAEEEEREQIQGEIERQQKRLSPRPIDNDTTFTSIERKLVHEWIQQQSDENTSPRTIRTLITRYLLGRLMISTFGFEPKTEQLISALSAQPIGAEIDSEELRAYQRVASTLQQLSE